MQCLIERPIAHAQRDLGVQQVAIALGQRAVSENQRNCGADDKYDTARRLLVDELFEWGQNAPEGLFPRGVMALG